MEAPDLSKADLKKGKSNPCPLHWQRKVVDALHEGVEAFMVGIMEDANLLAIHAWRVTIQALGYSAGKKNKGGPQLGCAQLQLNCFQAIPQGTF